MNINLTLIGQSIIFFLFTWFCMRFVWPPIMLALTQRKNQIADDLALAEKGRHELDLSQKKAIEVIRESKTKASDIINMAEKRADEIADEAKENAKLEAERILMAAKGDIEQEANRAKEQLRASLAGLVVAGASKVLEKEITAADHDQLLKNIVNEL